MEPSTTNTNGASSVPSAAARNGAMNSSPPSVGDSTLLCRCTLGRPGISPSATSSMLGSEAAVIETESPSQLRPSDVHRMWTSSTPPLIGDHRHSHQGPPWRSLEGSLRGSSYGHLFLRFVRDVQRIHQQLLAAHDVHGEPAARRAAERERLLLALRAALPAAHRRRDVLQHQLRALGRGALCHQLPRELERARHHLAQVADAHLDPRDPPVARVRQDHPQHAVGDRQLVHQQILGNGSPTSWSITRLPPKPVSTSTIPGGSVFTSPISAAPSPRAASAASAPSGATAATRTPSLATYIGSMPSSSHAPATMGGTGTAASRTIMATLDARASSLSTDATPPRVASRRQRRCGPAASSSASTAGHSDRVSDSTGAASSNSPRASMIAVPWAPISPETSSRSPGCSASGASRARESRRPTPVVHTYMPSAWPRSTTFVSPVTIRTPAASAAAAIAATSVRSTSASRPSSRISAALSASGRAPATARSLTVPLTASSPMEPPGKRSGLTTNESVVSATSSIIAASASSVMPNAGASSPSISDPVALPPAPWAIVMRSSRNFARLPRAVSMIPRIRSSRVALKPPHAPG